MTASKLSYTVPEAATMLGISPEQVKKEIRAGRLEARRTKPMEEKPSGAFRGGRFLVTEAAMREWLEGLEVA